MQRAEPSTSWSHTADATASAFVLGVFVFTCLVAAWTAWAAVKTQATSARVTTTSPLHQPAGATAARHRLTGADAQGRRATFDLFVFPRHLQWAAGSPDTIAAPGRWLTEWQVPAQLFDADIRARLVDAKAVIALGTATEADAASNPNLLAGLRAQTTGNWLASVVPPTMALRTVTLGLYQQLCARCENTIVTWRRPLAFAIALNAAPGIDLAGAFSNALATTTNIPSPEHFTTYAWVHVRR